MKAILMSIKPKWCEKIFSGEKTVEVRKTAPKEVPFKVYVYETKTGFIEAVRDTCPIWAFLRGKVIGEFVCDEKHDIRFTGASYTINNDISLTNSIARQSCLQFDDMFSYLGFKGGAALHITALKRYDIPKELSEFRKPDFFRDCEKDCRKNCDMEYYRCPTRDSHKASTMAGYCRKKGKNLSRPPQSYCYVEEIEE